MISRREFLQVTAATAAIIPNVSSRALAQQRLTQAELLAFEPLGNVTLLHVTDVHGQLMPVHFREPSINLGVGEARGQPPHITAKDYQTRFATAVKAAGVQRGDERVLLLDGGDTWQGSLGANRTKGQDMADCFKLLKPDAMTGHWEFTYGTDRAKELADSLGYPF